MIFFFLSQFRENGAFLDVQGIKKDEAETAGTKSTRTES